MLVLDRWESLQNMVNRSWQAILMSECSWIRALLYICSSIMKILFLRNLIYTFFFFERGFLTLFWGRTEGDVWLEALSIMFQINVKMLPIKIRFWLISSWLTRKETRKSQMLLGCIQCKSWEESVTKTKPSVSPRTLIILLQDILQQPVQIGLNELTQKPAVIYK